jgi:hypothetical protein
LFTDLTTRLLWVCLGVFIVVEARALGLGTLTEPGPGLLAFALGVMMALLAIVDGTRAWLHARPGHQGPSWRLPLRLLGAMAVLLAYIAFLETAGYALCTFAFLLVLFLSLGGLGWSRAFAFAALASAISYGVFRYGLGVQLPAGLLG